MQSEFDSYVVIWDSSRENDTKNASCLNRYNFRRVNAIDVPFATNHSTLFLYAEI